MSETKPCLNPGCPGLATRRAGESAGEWAKHRFCSQKCGVAHGNRMRGNRLAGGRAACPRTCAGCGEPYVRAATESNAQFAERVYCSARCKQLYPRRLVSTYPPRPCGRDGCPEMFVPAARNPHQKYCCDRCGRDAKRAYDRARKAASRPNVPPVERTCAWPGCGRTFTQPRQTRAKLYCCRVCYDRGKRARAAPAPRPRMRVAPVPTSPGWSGGPRETPFQSGATRLDWAMRVLGRHAPVYRESVVKPGSELWVFGSLRMTEREFIARAERDAARQAERAAA